MKIKRPSSRETSKSNGQIVNLEMLLQYLREEVYEDSSRDRLRIATVREFFPNGKRGPYGNATYDGHTVSFRLNRFHRVVSVVPNDETPSVSHEDRIWVLADFISPDKEIAVVWGKVEDLPPSFAIPSTFAVRAVLWIDSLYRKWRNAFWRGRLRRAHSFV